MRLQGTGGYDKTLAIASAFISNPDTVDVHFDNVPTTDSYTLTYIGGDGQTFTVFENIAFKDLNDPTPGN